MWDVYGSRRGPKGVGTDWAAKSILVQFSCHNMWLGCSDTLCHRKCVIMVTFDIEGIFYRYTYAIWFYIIWRYRRPLVSTVREVMRRSRWRHELLFTFMKIHLPTLKIKLQILLLQKKLCNKLNHSSTSWSWRKLNTCTSCAPLCRPRALKGIRVILHNTTCANMKVTLACVVDILVKLVSNSTFSFSSPPHFGW